MFVLNIPENYLYLHRDYQGSILAITNYAGDVLEKRKYDAWGSLTYYWNNRTQDQTLLPKGFTGYPSILLDRGYTGHEHLFSVDLIHMNGRLYDPLAHRFLQPDNYVTDPYNTQNFNRYGYVLNNPFKYTDPTGETQECPTCPPNWSINWNHGFNAYHQANAGYNGWEKAGQWIDSVGNWFENNYKSFINDLQSGWDSIFKDKPDVVTHISLPAFNNFKASNSWMKEGFLKWDVMANAKRRHNKKVKNDI